MFGWLRRKKSAEDMPSPGDTEQSGRPSPPLFEGLLHPGDATDAQRMAALQWSKAWCGYGGEITEAWLFGLGNTMIGKRLKGERKGEFEDEKRVLKMAVRALTLAASRNRGARVADAFPHVQFLLGPQEFPCERAQEMQNVILPRDRFPIIPLSGCTAPSCACWSRDIIKAEWARRADR